MIKSDIDLLKVQLTKSEAARRTAKDDDNSCSGIREHRQVGGSSELLNIMQNSRSRRHTSRGYRHSSPQFQKDARINIRMPRETWVFTASIAKVHSSK